MKYHQPQFRITAWPGVPIPIPSIDWIGSQPYILNESRTLLVPQEGAAVSNPAPKDARSRLARSVGEIYLDLIELDLNDVQQILEFANMYAILNLYEACFDTSSFRLPAASSATADIRRDRRQHQPAFFALERKWDSPRAAAHNDAEVETIGSFRLGAGLVRDAVRAWRLLQGEIDPLEESWESEDFARLETADYLKPLTRSNYEVTAEDFLVDFFDTGLLPFHPGLRIEPIYPWPGSARGVAVDPKRDDSRQVLDLYPVLCLELYNHIVENATYRMCANARCGRRFVRQQGRALHDQHRSEGVLYCSAACARAQAQRKYRRRMKQK